MSTSELFLDKQEIIDFIDEFYLDCDYSYGYKDQEFGFCPYLTFYIDHQKSDIDKMAHNIIDIYNDFEKNIIDKPFRLRYRSTGSWKNAEKWKPSREVIIKEMHEIYKKHFVYFIGTTTGSSNIQSAKWALKANLQELNNRYSLLKISFSEKWYKKNSEKWVAFVLSCIEKLKPIQAYSGYEIGNTTNFNIILPEFETAERVFVDYFYGLDIDHPNMQFSHENEFISEDKNALGGGIRTPTWCFLLSPYWLEKLGLTEEEIRAKLNDPRIEITKIIDTEDSAKYSLWIRLGELSLYPVEEGVPDLLVMANELIKPIRCDHLKLTTLDAWDDDPNPRFDAISSKQWIARFDEDSTWPELKRVEPEEQVVEQVTIVAAGEKCPYAGYWYTFAKENSRQYFNQGDIFPDFECDWGDVYWQYDSDE